MIILVVIFVVLAATVRAREPRGQIMEGLRFHRWCDELGLSEAQIIWTHFSALSEALPKKNFNLPLLLYLINH